MAGKVRGGGGAFTVGDIRKFNFYGEQPSRLFTDTGKMAVLHARVSGKPS